MKITSDILCYVVNEEIFPDKTPIIIEGNISNWIYVILEGKAKMLKKTRKENIIINTLKAGDFIGEMGLLQKGEHTQIFTIVADGPVTVGTLDITRLTKEWNTQPEKLQQLISNLIQKMDNMIEKVVSQVETSK